MKKYISVLAVLLLFPLSSFAYTSPLYSPPGSAGNPIHVQVEPTQDQKMRDLEASLKAQHGNSAFYSCMNKVSACSGDQSDPSRRYSCLQDVQYAFETPLCRANQPLQCDVGFTMVNGSCVRQTTTYPVFPIIVNPPAQKGPSCGEGTLLVNNKCVSYNESCRISFGTHTYGDKEHCYCDAGYEWSADGKSCVQSVSIHIDTAPAMSGGSGGSGSYTPPQDYNKECKNTYGSHGRWDGSIDDAAKTFGCTCDTGYQFNDAQTQCLATPVVVESESQTASLALLTDWQDPAEEPTPEPRRGLWAWLLRLFGI